MELVVPFPETREFLRVLRRPREHLFVSRRTRQIERLAERDLDLVADAQVPLRERRLPHGSFTRPFDVHGRSITATAYEEKRAGLFSPQRSAWSLRRD